MWSRAIQVNLKVTVPGDVPRAIAALAAVAGPGADGPRTGIGHDSHPFGPGMPLMLGGVEIPGAPRLHGHSDGDVALHAVADALLGAAGLGDLGRLFPAGRADAARHRQRELLAEVRRRLEAGGWRPTSVDVTIVAARPRLAGHLDAMRDGARRPPRARPGPLSTSRPRPAISTAPRAPGVRSRRSRSRRSGPLR